MHALPPQKKVILRVYSNEPITAGLDNEFNLQIGMNSGDTSSRDRVRQRSQPPTVRQHNHFENKDTELNRAGAEPETQSKPIALEAETSNEHASILEIAILTPIGLLWLASALL